MISINYKKTACADRHGGTMFDHVIAVFRQVLLDIISQVPGYPVQNGKVFVDLTLQP